MKFISLAAILSLCHCATIHIGNLEVQGKLIEAYGKELESFSGIAFARRHGIFELPKDVSYDNVEGKLDATQPGAICPGYPNPIPIPNMEGYYQSTSHFDFFDCLNLDVYRPKGGRNLKVLVQVHNNSLKELTRNQAHNQPEGLFRFTDNHVYVSVGTTMGPLGVWYKDETFNNVAIHEIIMALKWVQKYISAFGGNPEDVTLMGQGTAAALVEIALIYLRDFNKFGFESSPVTNVVFVSGTGNLRPPITVEEQLARQKLILSKIPACQENPEDCLSKITVEDINKVAATSPAFITPSLDSINMPLPISEMRKNGLFLHPQSVLVAVNHNESALLTVRIKRLIESLGMETAFNRMGLDFDKFRQVYGKDSAIECINAWINDSCFIRPAQELLEDYRNRGITTFEHHVVHSGETCRLPENVVGIDLDKLQNTINSLNSLGITNYLDQIALFDAKVFCPPDSPSLKFSEMSTPEVINTFTRHLVEYINTGFLHSFNLLPLPTCLSEDTTTTDIFSKHIYQINVPKV